MRRCVYSSHLDGPLPIVRERRSYLSQSVRPTVSPEQRASGPVRRQTALRVRAATPAGRGNCRGCPRSQESSERRTSRLSRSRCGKTAVRTAAVADWSALAYRARMSATHLSSGLAVKRIVRTGQRSPAQRSCAPGKCERRGTVAILGRWPRSVSERPMPRREIDLWAQEVRR